MSRNRHMLASFLLAVSLLLMPCLEVPLSAAPAKTATSSTAAKKRKPAARKPVRKKALAKTRSSKATVAKATSTTRRRTTKRRRASASRRVAISAAAREQATENIAQSLSARVDGLIEQPGALIPFFEQLYRQEQKQGTSPVRILHYGDSHTAADLWTSSIRNAFQTRFGDGGSGFSHAGSPWRGYRRFDVSGRASLRWQSAGLIGKASLRGDEFQGLSGVSVSTQFPKEWITLQARCSSLEVFYLQQPGGGRFLLYDNDELVAEHSTDGEYGPGILQLPTASTEEHEFRIVTADAAPVRLFGWVAEQAHGVTYEPLGINGAQASTTARWNPELFSAYVSHRDPSLIVVAYGTNESGHTIWDYDSYYAEFDALLKRIRKASPTAAILVVGPPDRQTFVRSRGWATAPRLELVMRAQRDAARANRVAFWDMYARMGGRSSMKTWVQAGLAAHDHVHFSGAGYRRLGETLYQDLMVQYNEFQELRQQWTSAASDELPSSQPAGNHEPAPRPDSATREEGFQEK